MSKNLVVVHNVVELTKTYLALKARAEKLAYSLQSLLPLAGKTSAVQEAFLQTFGQLKLIEQLNATAEQTLGALQVSELPADTAPDDLFGALVKLCGELIDSVVEEFGVAPEVALSATVKDLSRQLTMLETVITDAESTAKNCFPQ